MINVVKIDSRHFSHVCVRTVHCVVVSSVDVLEFPSVSADSVRRSLLRIDGLTSSRSIFIVDGFFGDREILSSSRPSLRMKMYKMMDQRPSNPLKMLKNHPTTSADAGPPATINRPNNQPRPCVTQEDKIRMTHRFLRTYRSWSLGFGAFLAYQIIRRATRTNIKILIARKILVGIVRK